MRKAIKYPRGSEWRKWDLHFHTPSSYDYKNGDVSDSDIIQTLKDNNISVVVITDHHIIDVDRISNLQKLAGDEITILPGIEFRSELGGSESIHFIGIFPEESDQFNLATAWVKIQGKFNLTPEEIVKTGDENVHCDLKEMSELIRGLGGIVSIHSGSKTNTIENITNALSYKQAQKREIVSYIDLYEIGRAENQEEYRKNVFPNINKTIPMVLCSDNHDINDYKLKCNCWIKADPTFEGLKQIIYEPDERVYIGNVPPSCKNTSNIIERIEINNSNRWFEESPILLNDSLVTIIGEKGAGKTALADFIALAGGDFEVQDDSGSFVFKALKSTKQIEETIDGCTVNLYWKDGQSDSITIEESFFDYSDSKKVRYLSQSFIERKCQPEQAGELQKEIEYIIFQYIPAQDRLGQTTFSDLKDFKTESVRLKQARTKKYIGNLNQEIFDIEAEISCLLFKKEEELKLQAEVKQLSSQKPKPATEGEKNISDKLALLHTRVADLDEKIATYKAQLTTIDTIKVQVRELEEYVEDTIFIIKDNLKLIGLTGIADNIRLSVDIEFNSGLDKKSETIKTKIQSLSGIEKEEDTGYQEDIEEKIEIEDINLESLTSEYIESLSLDRVSDLISALESKSTMAEEVRKIINDFDEKIRANQKRVVELQKSIKDIEEIKKPLLPEKIEARNKAYKYYFDLLIEEKNVLEEIYSPLKKKLTREDFGEDNKIDFFARVEFDVNSYFERADEIIDFSRKGTYYHDKPKLYKAIKAISEKIELAENLDIHGHITNLYTSFEKDGDNTFNINEQLLKGKNKNDFYDWIFDVSDFNVTYSIKYQDTNIELLSPGKKGIVLLLMYLALDTESGIPLIIDQPEENLDNKSVYSDLINFFRKGKKRRQIIVITHNPNLVLNTDAEQVVVANFEAVPETYKSRITYISGAIENSFIDTELEIPLLRKGIREHGADILEGGKDAFIKRKNKYAY